MKYKELKIIKMSKRDQYENEYSLRFNSPSTHRSSLLINPFKNEVRMNEKHELFVLMTIEIINKLDKIRNNSSKISRLTNEAPSEPLNVFLVRKVIIEEILSNNEIEGVYTTRQEIIHIANNQNAESQLLNIISQHGSMYSFLNFQVHQNPVNYTSPNDIRTLYDNMVSKDVSNDNALDGEIFRKEIVAISDETKVVSRGLTPESAIITELSNMINYLNHNDMSPIIKILLSHYFFEYIHPFYDGNGRTGRYLICNYLLHELDILSAFSFSTAINRHKKGYYDAFLTVSNPSNKGEATHFVLFLLDIMIDAQEKMINEIGTQLEILHGLKSKIDDLTELSSDEKNVVYIIAQSWVFSVKEDRINVEGIANHIDKSKQTVHRICKKAMDLGVLRRYKKRPAVYTLSKEFYD